MADASPPFGVCQFSTPRLTLAEDIAVYHSVGAQVMGVCEYKLREGEESAAADAMRQAGLLSGGFIPSTQSILPLAQIVGIDDPESRVASIAASLRRFAPFQPVTVILVTGPAGSYGADARRIVIDGLRALSATAREVGIALSLEPIHSSVATEWSLVTTVGETAALLDEAKTPDIGILVDFWHLWDTPKVLEELEAFAARVPLVHVADWRRETRGWADRALPGEGIADLSAMIRALTAGGYQGPYELEIFSDDGFFGANYPDSLWKEPPAEMIRRGQQEFLKAWENAHAG